MDTTGLLGGGDEDESVHSDSEIDGGESGEIDE